MNVLIVEDNDSKYDDLRKTSEALGWTILRAASFTSALRQLTENDISWKGMILDISIPTYDLIANQQDGSQRNFGGREILRTLSSLGLSIPTIVVSGFESFEDDMGLVQFERLVEDLRNIPQSPIVCGVQYSAFSDAWRSKVIEALKSIEKMGELK